MANLVVVAWGNHGVWRGRDAEVLAMLTRHMIEPHALRVTDRGNPEHPLFVPMDRSPFPFKPTTTTPKD